MAIANGCSVDGAGSYSRKDAYDFCGTAAGNFDCRTFPWSTIFARTKTIWEYASANNGNMLGTYKDQDNIFYKNWRIAHWGVDYQK